MRSIRYLLILVALLITACATLSEQDRAELDTASQFAATAMEQSASAKVRAQQALDAALDTHASAIAQQALDTAHDAQEAAAQAQSMADDAARSAAQSAREAEAAKAKTDQMYQKSLRNK